MQEMQPQIQAIQKKYKDNPQKMQEEFQKIGYNPAETLSGCLPLLIQFPILIGLYRAILIVLGSTPLALLELTQRVNPGIDLTPLLPISNRFAWLNLGQPDPFYILPILVLATMFIQQKLLSPTAPKNQSNEENPTAAMTQSMQYTMPIMFGFFSLSFPAGLSIYFVLANLIGIGQGYYMRHATASERAASEERKQNNTKKVASGDESAPVAKSSGSARSSTAAVAKEGSPQLSKRKRRSAKK
jgi:YidC/Oxa1 family membrane protein insertase